MAEGKKGRKVGRSKRNGQSMAYKNESRREKSHVRRIIKHLNRYGDDLVALKALKHYKTLAGIK